MHPWEVCEPVGHLDAHILMYNSHGLTTRPVGLYSNCTWIIWHMGWFPPRNESFNECKWKFCTPQEVCETAGLLDAHIFMYNSYALTTTGHLANLPVNMLPEGVQTFCLHQKTNLQTRTIPYARHSMYSHCTSPCTTTRYHPYLLYYVWCVQVPREAI